MRVVATVEEWPQGDGSMLAAVYAAECVRRAWAHATPGVDVEVLPIGDGGPRLLDVLDGPAIVVGGAQAVETEHGIVLGPAGRSPRWNPQDLSAALLGLSAEAASAGKRVPVVVPVGDTAPAGDAIDLWGGGLEALRSALGTLSMTVLVGSMRPLLGLHGMSAATMVGRESDTVIARAAQDQENRWAEIAHESDALAGRHRLIGPERLSMSPGAGAAGGLAYCLAAAGARLTRGAHFAADIVGLRHQVEDADLIAAFCPSLVPATLENGTAAVAAVAAGEVGVPAIAVAAAVAVGDRDVRAGGLAGAFHAGDGEDALSDQVERVAYTWTRSR